MSQTGFNKYLPPVSSKLVPKLKSLIIYWNLAHSIFQICPPDINPGFDVKYVFYQIFTNYYAPIGPKTSNAQNLFKFDQTDLNFDFKNDFC